MPVVIGSSISMKVWERIETSESERYSPKTSRAVFVSRSYHRQRSPKRKREGDKRGRGGYVDVRTKEGYGEFSDRFIFFGKLDDFRLR